MSLQQIMGNCGSVTLQQPWQTALHSHLRTWRRMPFTRPMWRRTSLLSAPQPHVCVFQLQTWICGSEATSEDSKKTRWALGSNYLMQILNAVNIFYLFFTFKNWLLLYVALYRQRYSNHSNNLIQENPFTITLVKNKWLIQFSIKSIQHFE